MVAIIPLDRDQPNILTASGKQVEMFVISDALEAMGGAIEAKSYRVALAELKKGNLRTNTGKIYNTTRMVSGDIHLIDGTLLKNVSMGKLFGNKRNGIVNTTKGLNQVEVFRPNYLKGGAELLRGASMVFDIASWANSDNNNIDGGAMLESAIGEYVTVIKGTGAGMAVGLLLAVTGSEFQKDKLESNELIFESLFNGNTSVNEAKMINRNLFDSAFVDFAANTIEKFLTGNITDLEDLYKFDTESGNYENGSGSLLFSIDSENNQALIHAIYVPDKKK